MKAVCYERPYTVTVKDVPVPTLRPNDVLVRVEAAGICGTDVHLYQGEFDPRFPLIPGHEFAGVVVEVGEHVTRWTAGDRVAVDPNLYCDQCYYCRQDLQNHCVAWEAIGVTLPGGFAEFVAVPERSLYSIGDLSFAEGAFIEPLSCVVYGQERAGIPTGSSVLIFGAGPIGLLHQQLIKRAGAASVTISDLRSERLELARQLGADHTVVARDPSEMQERLRAISTYGFDLVIDATGVPAVVQGAVKYVKNGGTLLLFGVCPNESEIALNPYEIYRRDLSIVGAFALRKSFHAARNLLAAKAVDVEALIGETVNLTDYPEALALMQRGEAPMKIQVDPQNRQAPLMRAR